MTRACTLARAPCRDSGVELPRNTRYARASSGCDAGMTPSTKEQEYTRLNFLFETRTYRSDVELSTDWRTAQSDDELLSSSSLTLQLRSTPTTGPISRVVWHTSPRRGGERSSTRVFRGSVSCPLARFVAGSGSYHAHHRAQGYDRPEERRIEQRSSAGRQGRKKKKYILVHSTKQHGWLGLTPSPRCRRTKTG